MGLFSDSVPSAVTFGVIAAGAFIYFFLQVVAPLIQRRPPKNAPCHARSEEWPIVGVLNFFTDRWDFIKRASKESPTGNFSFYVGNHLCVCLRGPEARRTFFESRALDLGAGYGTLLGGQPGEGTGGLVELSTSNQRLVALLKGPVLRKNLPDLRNDTRRMFDDLAMSGHSGITEPFDLIYRTVFQLTLRTVACKELADDPKLGAKLLAQYEMIEKTGDTALSVMYPWLWTVNKVRRSYAGFRSYMLFKGFVDDRQRTGRREDDALQFLLDAGDDLKMVITFVLGSLYAGQLNSGINAAWMVIYLSKYPYWRDQVRAEVEAVAARYCADDKLKLKEKLMQVPAEAWENEFPVIDLCLKETIRRSTQGTAFRQNISGADLPIAETGEVIPDKAFAVFPAPDTYANEGIYPNALEWDPNRYRSEKSEDQKEAYAYWGWGAARHPCLGMRFAKLENNMIVAFWLAYFDSELCDERGNPTDHLPTIDYNAHSAHKPAERCFLHYNLRQD